MSDREPIVELCEEYSGPGGAAPAWADVVEVLTTSEMFWLSTVRGNGRPHVTPLPAIWLDGALHVCTGSAEQKAKNLTFEPRCILTTGTSDLRSGLDVVVEGEARRVTDRGTLEHLAALWKSKLDWDFEIGDEGFRDADGRSGLVFGVSPTKVLAFAKEPYSQTRYRFAA